jgi:NTE family protein
MPIPFAAVSLDLEAGEEVVHTHGRLREAATASSAIPGILPPVRMNGRVLVDGGWVDKIPVLPAYCLGADVVIAADISADIEDTEGYERGVDVMFRANAIKDAAFVRFLRRLADVVLEPEVKHIHWADFTAIDECIEAGDRAATAAVPKIQELLRRERWRSIFRPRLGKRLALSYVESGDVKVCIE